jgi:hypothetical protein
VDLAADRSERSHRMEATGRLRRDYVRPDHRDRDQERAHVAGGRAIHRLPTRATRSNYPVAASPWICQAHRGQAVASEQFGCLRVRRVDFAHDEPGTSAGSPRDGTGAAVAAEWKRLRVFEILREHEWIEPGEEVSDDLLLGLGISEPVPTLFEAWLVCRWSRWGRNIDVFTRQFVPVDSTIGKHEESAADAGG